MARFAAALRADLIRASTAVSQPSGPPLAFMAPPRGTFSPSPAGNIAQSHAWQTCVAKTVVCTAGTAKQVYHICNSLGKETNRKDDAF